MLTTIELDIGISVIVGGIVLIISWLMISSAKNMFYSFIEKNEKSIKVSGETENFIKNTLYPAFKEQEDKLKSLELEINNMTTTKPVVAEKKVEKSMKETMLEKMQELVEKGELSKEEFDYMKTINGIDVNASKPTSKPEIIFTEKPVEKVEKTEQELLDFLKVPKSNAEVAKFLKKSIADSFNDLKNLVNNGKVKKDGIKYKAL